MGRVGASNGGAFGQGEVEVFLLWPPHWEDVSRGSEASKHFKAPQEKGLHVKFYEISNDLLVFQLQ